MSKLISRKYGRSYAGQTIILPHVGEVTFDEAGFVEIQEDLVADVVKDTSESFNFVGGPDSNTDGAGGDKKEDDGLSEDERNEWKDLIGKASTKELLEMAKLAKLGKPDKIASMTDEKIRVELLKKISVLAGK